MKDIQGFIFRMKDLGVNISLKNEDLKIVAPKNVLNSEIVNDIKKLKLDIIEFLKKSSEGDIYESYTFLKPAIHKDFYPLSAAQKRMYFLQQMDLNSITYNVTNDIPLSFDIKKEKIEEIFQELIVRHESFRTIFEVKGDEPVQLIKDKVDFKVEEYTIEKSEEQDFRKKFIKTFDLSHAPLIRVVKLNIKNKNNLILTDMHHIISDGVSINILEKEFHQLSQGVKLLPQKLQYKDYSEWLNSEQNNEKFKKQETYWLKKFSGEVPTLILPTDYKRSDIQNSHGSSVGFVLDKKKMQIIKSLTKEYDLTLNMYFLSIFTILLSKLSGQDDIIVGCSIEGRNHSDMENIVGMFVNTLALRNEVKENDTLKQFFSKLRQATLEAYDNQDYQFDKLIEELNVKRISDRNPLFDVMINTLNFGEVSNNTQTNSEEYFISEDTQKRFDLTLNMHEFKDGIEIIFQFDAGLFKTETIIRYIEYFKNIINYIHANPESIISDIQISEYKQLDGLQEKVIDSSLNKQVDLKLSFHQERIWFIDEFERGYLYKDSPTYHNIPLILNIQNSINEELLEKSFNDIIREHSIFQSQFYTKEDTPYYLLRKETLINIRKINIKDEDLDTAIDNEVLIPFDLRNDLLIRILNLKKASGENVLVIVSHHIICDRKSLKILFKDVWSRYKEYSQNNKSTKKPQILKFESYNIWQKKSIQEIKELNLGYWKSELKGRLKPIELPEDKKRDKIHIYKSAIKRFKIEGFVYNQLDGINSVPEPDNLIKLLAAFKILLSIYSNNEEVVIGTISDNRANCYSEQTIGPIANLLVLRSFINKDYTYSSFCNILSRAHKNANEHKYMPFDLLVNELAPEKDMSRTALFDVLFHYEDENKDNFLSNEHEMEIYETNLGLGKYDINLLIKRKKESFECTLVYNNKYFKEKTIDRFVKHYIQLLINLQIHPNKNLKDVEMITNQEKEDLLYKLNNYNINYPKEKTVHELFEEQVKKNPNRISVSYNDVSLTYQELNNKSNQLARYLMKLGVSIEDIVSLYLSRDIDVIICILGILKSAGAYLPIDKVYPKERINKILKNSNPKVLICRGNNELKVNHQCQVINLDKTQFSSEEIIDIPIKSKPNNLAYIIYTSGSSGTPKGVMIEHRNIVRLLKNDSFLFDFNQEDIWTMFHSHGFDFSVWEMYGALLNGGVVNVISKELAINTQEFYSFLKRRNVTVLNQTPAAFYNLIEEDKIRKFDLCNIRYIIFGGDSLNLPKLKYWKEKYKKTKLINMFGITETTVHVTYKDIQAKDIRNGICTIGKPIPTTHTYILNENNKVQPYGIIGEICVGGVGVGRGYTDQQILSEEKFIENPYIMGDKLYKSGDLGRILENGEIEYLGRKDNQVQIRGYRVELGEIENVLSCYNHIKECIVLARNENEDKYLCAYIISKEEINQENLRNYLSIQLPDYMVPSYFVEIDKLPLTLNGKIDRKALPLPEIKVGKEYIAPSNEIEEILVEIWSMILNLDRDKISLNKSFFELGGNSLKIIQLNSALKNDLKWNISVADLFIYTTIESLIGFMKNNKLVNDSLEGKKEVTEMEDLINILSD